MTRGGVWYHKPGQTPVTNLDTDGMQLDPEESAARGRLRVGKTPYIFCKYMWVASRETRYALSKKLNLAPYEDALVKALEEDAPGADLRLPNRN
jgi:hypothetical protein